MLSIVLTYRNRNLTIVKKCLDSLKNQTNSKFSLYLINYGSSEKYTLELEILIKSYSFVKYISVSTHLQLWNKSRAINIALKKCDTPYFLMGDIDLIYHPEMVEKCIRLIKKYDSVYFKYAYLNQRESSKSGSFFDFQPSFYGNSEVTGTTLYQTEILKEINGYDEFYHGWGAEDTDVHLRLKNAGYSVYFYKAEILVKHQWHPKDYRSKKSTYPFHTMLERTNHQYMLQNDRMKTVKANLNFNWGKMPSEKNILALKESFEKLEISSEISQIDAFLTGVLPQLKYGLEINIVENKQSSSIKNRFKKILGKKHIETYDMAYINNRVLEEIIKCHRLASYTYDIDWNRRVIHLKIIPDA
ncbi:glycosyl transferase family 2 [Zunongwangia profunda SM-A87]|uniref:Glycosyl transferase family 2 n=1 Tax=Zunongwangia profunda (strain DSM 18752 / CCTCC AB 206139 / SM-A87) TaxID=655815 RepID=D5BIJ7_ZUNPS|nr:glycosyltransferase [Zunongwangia profunda]ADF51449.1 glycosyl transferase family 2 [Zunongwangia profunda SM-A87]